MPAIKVYDPRQIITAACFISPRSHHIIQIFTAISAAIIIATYQFAFAAGNVTRDVTDGGAIAAYGVVMAMALVFYALIKAAAIAYSTHVAYARLAANPIGGDRLNADSHNATTQSATMQCYNFLTARMDEESFAQAVAFIYALIIAGAVTGLFTTPIAALMAAAMLFAIVNVIGAKLAALCTVAGDMPTAHEVMRSTIAL
jgi:hypothetical protein